MIVMPAERMTRLAVWLMLSHDLPLLVSECALVHRCRVLCAAPIAGIKPTGDLRGNISRMRRAWTAYVSLVCQT